MEEFKGGRKQGEKEWVEEEGSTARYSKGREMKRKGHLTDTHSMLIYQSPAHDSTHSFAS